MALMLPGGRKGSSTIRLVSLERAGLLVDGARPRPVSPVRMSHGNTYVAKNFAERVQQVPGLAIPLADRRPIAGLVHRLPRAAGMAGQIRRSQPQVRE
jgi:hypothetical protein